MIFPKIDFKCSFSVLCSNSHKQCSGVYVLIVHRVHSPLKNVQGKSPYSLQLVALFEAMVIVQLPIAVGSIFSLVRTQLQIIRHYFGEEFI